MRLAAAFGSAVASLPRSQEPGENHAQIVSMGPSTWDCFGGEHGDQRSFAGRPHCAAGSAPGRRRASSRGNCPIHLEGPPLLLVQQGMARRRLVSVWFWFKARHGLGWSGGMARMAPARPPPGHSASETWAARNPASATTPATASRQELMAALSIVRRPRRGRTPVGARHVLEGAANTRGPSARYRAGRSRAGGQWIVPRFYLGCSIGSWMSRGCAARQYRAPDDDQRSYWPGRV
ncbi:hypothetical protein J2R80_007949 [Bradyrhizobium sp. USDA 4541]|nr:hypothetical protein [Bradyrhizobium sp. USDA 4541]